MHKPEPTTKHVDHKELSKRLQSEVELILTNVDDKMLFAEFREDEMFTIQNGDRDEVVYQTLDERILVRNPKRESAIERIDRRTTKTAKKVTRVGRLFRYLFKPLQY
jgi:hypothetical protein